MTFFTSLHLLNLKQSHFILHTVDVDCIKLSEKYNCVHGYYTSAKNEYFQSRCSKCEHQWSVKRNVKFLDKLSRQYKCLYLSWDLNQPLILFFSNGSVVSIEFNDENNTVLKVEIDNNLCGKFPPSRLVDVVMCKNYIYVTYTEPKLSLIHINHESPSLLSKIFGRKKGKLVGFEPKIVNFDLYVHSNKSLERKLSLNTQKDLLLVWWKNSGDDVWPWTPIAHLSDRVNMLVYSINGAFIELLCSVKVQDELLHANFSKQLANQLFTLEEIKKEGEIIVNICVHEIIHGQCQLIYTAKLPVRGNLIAFDWSYEDKLLAADSDGLLLIYDANKKSTIVTNLEFLPRHLSWHPQSCIALIVGRNNNLVCFDAALNVINFKLSYKTSLQSKFLELNSYFHSQFTVQKVLWQKSAFNDTCLLKLDAELSSFVFVKFSFGCITRHNVTALEIVSQYLKCNCIDRSILVLRSLDWCSNSDIKFQCLSKIANFLFRKPLNSKHLSGLELALGTFYDWVEILPKRIVEMYEHRMHHLARRFFHHLLRYHKFRKAFLLAVDLESQDLFLDLYHVAKQRGENILASVALHKAEELEDSCDSYSESCPSETHSESSSSSGNDVGYNDKVLQSVSTNEEVWTEVKWPDNNAQISVKSLSDHTSQEKEYRQTVSNSYKHNTYNSKKDHLDKSTVSNYPSDGHSETMPLPSPSVLHHLPKHSSSIANTYMREPYFSDQSPNASNLNIKVCDNYNVKNSNVRESSVADEENEEMEGTKIKLAHLGII